MNNEAQESSNKKWIQVNRGSFNQILNPGGATLGYVPESGVRIITVDGLAFKDLNKDGQLDPYEDWRRPTKERAEDLASKMTIEQIAGLMLYSMHQAIPAMPMGPRMPATYGGKLFPESGAKSWDLSDQQRDFLTKDHLRHVLLTKIESPEVAVKWNNNVQAFAEGIDLGIPTNNCSDPRHGIRVRQRFV